MHQLKLKRLKTNSKLNKNIVSNNNIDNVSISFAEDVVKDVLIQVDELIKMN